MEVANERTLRDLEYGKVLEIVASHAASSLGREAVLSLKPSADPSRIRAEFELVEEMREAVRRGFVPGGIPDIRPILHEAREHGDLDPTAFLEVADLLEATAHVKRELDTPRYPGLAALVGALSPEEGLLGAIRRTVDRRGRIRDDATPKLRMLHRLRAEVDRELREILNRFIQRHRELVQEPLITQRGGRYVVPVKSGAQGTLGLVVHDTSASEKTIFAEPIEAVHANNRLREIGDEIERELRRIRKELVGRLLVAEGKLRRNMEVLGRIDSLYARASYALRVDAVIPELLPEHRLELVEARHPLLGERAVPITVSLGDPQRAMVLTGPNTGGKTVTLKTIGLFVLMAQSGIPLPASPRTRFGLFRKVRSDIGEEQSIEQNLSTFSSHMTNIVGILAEADEDTLVILDELGAGTDPQEGAALGLAILEYLLERGATVAVATHLTPLKYFAIMHPEVKSCSMEFDLETLSPTFRVLEGVPGSSNALAIAQRLGIPQEVLERARGHFSAGEVRAEEIIQALSRERATAERTRKELEWELKRVKGLREEYERKLRELKEKRKAALGAELSRLQEEIRRAKRELEYLISVARKESSLQARREALQRLEEVQGRLRSLGERPSRVPVREFKEGQTVRIRATRSLGVVRAVGEKGVEVEVRGKRVWLHPGELEPAAPPPQPRGEEPGPIVPQVKGVDLELYVHGMKVPEALRRLESWLDKLLVAGFHTGHIIHGKGTGALREAIHRYLAQSPYVKRFYLAPPEEGGEGVTVVELE